MLTFQPVSWLTEHALLFSFFPLRPFPAPPSSSVAANLSPLSPSYLKLPKLPCLVPLAAHLHLSSPPSMLHPPPPNIS